MITASYVRHIRRFFGNLPLIPSDHAYGWEFARACRGSRDRRGRPRHGGPSAGRSGACP
ncbi:hypothetical protein BN9982_1130006 [Mycobacterium tuberculosis]|nr:hypothetical protein BN9982_1130006 [Mycobacterium tuberculosis]